MRDVLAIDPGPEQSGWCHLVHGKPISFGITENGTLLNMVRLSTVQTLAIEMIASYGMAVGAPVFETCVWIGRFKQAWRKPEEVRLIFNRTIAAHICGQAKANQTNIRTALIDRFGKPGTKKKPGLTFGITSHMWSALAVAVTAAEIAPPRRRAKQ